MKAWRFRIDEDEGFDTIIYAETRNKARAEALRQSEDEWKRYTDVTVYREKWADKYGSFENIPTIELLKRGWEWQCQCCGTFIGIDDLSEKFPNNIVCKDCEDNFYGRRCNKDV